MYFNGIYYPNWHIYKGLPPSSLKYDVISHAFYAFAHVKPDGTVFLSDEWADSQMEVDGVQGCLRSFAELKKKYSVLRVVLSVGGGGVASEPFPAAASSDETRERFAATARDLVTTYGLDGIDVDWEHPSNSQQGADYIRLLATLRAYLPAPQFTLTSAIGCGEWCLQHINLAQASYYLDLINVMTYDFSGPWVPSTEHHAQLYSPQRPHNQHCQLSCHSAINYLVSHGVPTNKILLGVPAYGRSFTGSHGVGHKYGGHAGEEGTFEYKDLPRPGAQEYVDDRVGAAFCVGGDGGFVTYDNAQTVRQKAEYVKQNRLAGLFYWTGTGDKQDNESSLVWNGYVADYNPIDHINQIFTHPSSLSSIQPTSQALHNYQYDLDEDIAEVVGVQSLSDAESVRHIQNAKQELDELFSKIENVRDRAMHTEQTITDMTADIKRLDNTKRNLTLSMTALKRLQMLTTAYEQLRGLSKTRQYRECAQLLQAVIQLVAHFKTYRSIDQIATLSRNVADLQRELLEQICEDFEVTFAKAEVAQRRGMLAEACMVMDALGEHARSRLVNWYCNTQLREYRQVFRGNDEAGSLDNIARRYSWFNRMLKTYDSEHAVLFPPFWRVNEMLANAFCEGTRDDFKGILQRTMRQTGQSLDVNLLLSCLQETLDFEHSLERKFSNESRSSMDTVVSREGGQTSFTQAISEAFEPYMSLWVESQDKQLAALMPKYRQQPLRNADDEFSPQSVIPSSTELFHFYRTALAQCAKLSTGIRLAELSRTFARYLDSYGQQVLFYFLGERTSVEDMILILNTADYCYSTCNQLEEKIRNKIDEEYKERVDLQSQADAFMGIASASVRSLVRKVELDCEQGWREMRNTPWSKLESVGDQSSYVGELLRHIKERGAEILKYLHKQQYARAFCDNLVDSTVNTYILSIVQCRPVSEVGAEQMLLDSYVLKKGFTELSTINSEDPGAQPPAAFVKRINNSMSKLDPLLKTLQVRPSPPEALVQAYLIHIADRSDTNFRKILDLKGIRKAEQAGLVDLFIAHRQSPSHVSLPAQSSLLTPLQISSGTPSIGSSSGGPLGSSGLASGPLAGIGGIGALGSQGGRFDAATFASGIMNAARDGVDRFGSGPVGAGNVIPAMAAAERGGSGGVMGDGSATANLNENLKNIGKFFRRDVGSFGRFGRTGTGLGD